MTFNQKAFLPFCINISCFQRNVSNVHRRAALKCSIAYSIRWTENFFLHPHGNGFKQRFSAAHQRRCTQCSLALHRYNLRAPSKFFSWFFSLTYVSTLHTVRFVPRACPGSGRHQIPRSPAPPGSDPPSAAAHQIWRAAGETAAARRADPVPGNGTVCYNDNRHCYDPLLPAREIILFLYVTLASLD